MSKSTFNLTSHLVSLILKSGHVEDGSSAPLASRPLPTLEALYLATVSPAKFKVGDRVVAVIPAIGVKTAPYPFPGSPAEKVVGVVKALEQDRVYADADYNGHLVYVEDAEGVVWQCAEEWVVHPA